MRLAVVTALLLLAAPSSALAARAEIVGGQLQYTGASGEANTPSISREGDEFHVVDNGAPRFPDVGPGCRISDQPYGFNRGALCQAAGVTSIAVNLGDRDDTLSIAAGVEPPITYSGGGGTDLALYLSGSPAVAISADGVANDGPARRDNIGTDVETLLGTAAADSLVAGPEDSTLRGGTGRDRLAGGPGDDSIGAASIEDVGIDLGGFTPDGRDRVTCGGGHDYVLADIHDVVAADCEVVARNRRHGNYAYEIRGSAGADRITPREFFENPVRILAGAGNDDVRTTGDDALYGGPGNDVLRGGRADGRAVTHFDGGRGDDRIHSRDDAADFVRCGRGSHDRAYVDHRDRVARDCEEVSRKG